MQTIYSSNQLLSICNAEPTQINICIAQKIINIYNNAKNFYQEDVVSCFKEFLSSGNLDLAKYNIKF